MSNICVGIVKGVSQSNTSDIATKIDAFVKSKGYGVFFDNIYQEPFFEKHNGDLIFSLADSYNYDNCEMLLLRDGWMFNDKSNIVPFKERMQYLCDLINYIQDLGYAMEMYIGESGTEAYEYDRIVLNPQELVRFMVNENTERALHFVMGA